MVVIEDERTMEKKGILELCVLLLISNKDRYGYELVEEISKKIHHFRRWVIPAVKTDDER